jgi:hypothetical protein
MNADGIEPGDRQKLEPRGGEFLAPLTLAEKVAVSNALPSLCEEVIAGKRSGNGCAGAESTSLMLNVPSLLWRLDVPDLERLAAALVAGMRAEAAAPTDPKEAVRLFQQALELNPFCDMAAMGCGVCLFHDGRAQEAMEWIEHSLRINPHNEKARRNLEAIKSKLEHG